MTLEWNRILSSCFEQLLLPLYHFCLLTILLRLCCYGRKKTTAEKTEINKQVYTENCARCEIFGCPNEFFGLWEQVDGCRWHHNFLCHAPHLQMHNLSRDGQSESGLEGERERKIADYVVKMSQDIKVKCWVRKNTVCVCVFMQMRVIIACHLKAVRLRGAGGVAVMENAVRNKRNEMSKDRK